MVTPKLDPDETDVERQFRLTLSPQERMQAGRRNIKDEDKRRFGGKMLQCSPRLSAAEVELATQVCARMECGFTDWATYALLTFAGYSAKLPVEQLNARILGFSLWVPPGPTVKQFNMRLAQPVRAIISRHFGDAKLAAVVRWVMWDEGPRALQRPTRADLYERAQQNTLAAEAARQQREAQAAQQRLPTIQALLGNTLDPIEGDE